MARILWTSWSPEYAKFEFPRIKALDLKNEWLDGNTATYKPGDIWFTGNGTHPRPDRFSITMYYEPYIYIKNELDHYKKNLNNWNIRLTYNPDYVAEGTKVVPFAGYWACENPHLSDKIHTFGMILGNKRVSPKHHTDIGFMRGEWVKRLQDHDFIYWGPNWDPDPKCKGWTDTLVEDLSTTKFSLVIENSVINGYLTEKIWNSLRARSIPVYYGHRSVYERIPKDCFIYGFDYSKDEIVTMCENMSDKEYNQYIQNINEFVKQDKEHSWENLYRIVDSLI